jgi:hypothetical protein
MPGSGGMLPARSTSPSNSRRIASCDFSIEYRLQMWTAPTCQDGSRLLIGSLALRCPACLRELGSLAKMVFATPAPSTLAASMVPV